MKRFTVLLSNGLGEEEMKSAPFLQITRSVGSVCEHYGTADPFYGPVGAAARSFLWLVEVYGDDAKFERFVRTLENEVRRMHAGALEILSCDGYFEFPGRTERKSDGIVFVPAEVLGQDLSDGPKTASCTSCGQEIALFKEDGESWFHVFGSPADKHAALPAPDREEHDGEPADSGS